MSEKSEKPTSKRSKDARKKGQIAKSQDLTSAIQLACMVSALAYFSPGWLVDIVAIIDQTLCAVVNTDFAAIKQVMISCGWLFIRIIGTGGGIVLAGSLAVQFSQVGFTLATGSYTQVGQRMNPIMNLKQMFSLASVFELTKSLLKLLVVSGVFAMILHEELSSVQFLSQCGAQCALYFSADLLSRLFLGLLVAYVFFAMMDYSFQKRRITRQLMMSKDEVKQEIKNTEGNQEIKHHRKELHRELQQRSMKQMVRKSSFVIRNPTHIAICIRYNETDCPLPKILDKATNLRAKKIMEMAESENIPMVENVNLARRLLKDIPAGQFITADFYDDMAAVIHFVDGLKP
jgi:type III secretion protein U